MSLYICEVLNEGLCAAVIKESALLKCTIVKTHMNQITFSMTTSEAQWIKNVSTWQLNNPETMKAVTVGDELLCLYAVHVCENIYM